MVQERKMRKIKKHEEEIKGKIPVDIKPNPKINRQIKNKQTNKKLIKRKYLRKKILKKIK